MYLLGPRVAGQAALWEMLESGAVELAALDEDDVPRMTALIAQIPGSAHGPRRRGLCAGGAGTFVGVFTLDQRDFPCIAPLGSDA